MKRKIYLCSLATLMLLSGCSGKISEEEAREIALSDAGLLAADVSFIKSELDYDDGREYYDVEFYVPDQQEYNYEIDVYSGEIVERDVEPIYNEIR